MAKIVKIEDYIVSESEEINYSLQNKWLQRFFKAFPALTSKNYKLYFSGQFISLIGTWLQVVAQGWLVFQITNSSFWVGMVSALGSLPILIFTLFGGVIVDSFNKKIILFITQGLSMILALILGFMTLSHTINLFSISVLAFLLGLINAVDHPARQAFVVEMVGKEKLASAITLNATQFNSGRVIGPGIAGYLIAFFGIGGAYITNGISYIAVIIALFFIKTKKTQNLSQLENPINALKEGLSYAFSHSIIKTLLIFTAATSIFGWSYTTILPVIVANVFKQDVSTLGLFYSTAGIGAVTGAIAVSIFYKKTGFIFLIILGNFILGISLILFSFTKNINLALPLLFLIGTGLVMQFSTTATTIQHLVKDNFRGRVMSIYTLMFIGMSPLGSLQVGIISQHFGSQFAIFLGGIVVFVFGVYLLLTKNNINNFPNSNTM